MSYSRLTFILVAFAMSFGLVCQTVAQGLPDPVDLPKLTDLVEKTIDIRLKDDTIIANAVVEQLKEGKVKGSIKTLKVKTPKMKRASNVSSAKIKEIYFKEAPLDVIYDKTNRCIVYSIEKKIDRQQHRKAVKKRLSANRDRYWEPMFEEDHAKFMKAHRAFIGNVKSKMPGNNLQLVETKYFLFLTDLSATDAQNYIVYLDAMYEELCMAFGLSPEKNIWCGKCVVVAFEKERDFLQFEARVMNNGNARGAQGLCHQSKSGTVIFSGFQGDNGFFGHVLVHETSHGFVHRYMTTARAPSWLNEGMADWLADKIVQGDKIPKRRKRSAMVINQIGWGNFLEASQIDGDYYGAASSLVEILVSIDRGGQFKLFFDGIKEGKPADESLKDSFGISYQELLIMYAEAASKLK